MRQDRQRADRVPGAPHRTLEQRRVVVRDAGRARLVEQIRAVLDDPFERAVRLPHRDQQIEPRPIGQHRDQRRRQSGQTHWRDRRVVQRERHLEQRVPAHVPIGLQLRHQRVERHLLVRERGERVRMHPLHELPEAGVAVDTGAQRQRIHEESDQRLQLGAVSPGDRKSDDDVFLAGVAMQQRVVRREKHGERRDPLLPGQRRDARRQRRLQAEHSPRAAEGLDLGPLPIGGQIDDR